MNKAHTIKNWIVKEENGGFHCVHIPSNRYFIFSDQHAIQIGELCREKMIPKDSLISKLFLEDDLSMLELEEFELYSNEEIYASGAGELGYPLDPLGSFT